MTYTQIMRMVKSACCDNFRYGYTDSEDEVIRATTQIYIAQMQIDAEKKESEDD